MNRLEKFAVDQKLPLNTETVLKFIELHCTDNADNDQKAAWTAADGNK